MTREAGAKYLHDCIDEAGLTPKELGEGIGLTGMAGRLWTIGEKKGGKRLYTMPNAENLRKIAKKVKGFSMDKYLNLCHADDEQEEKEKFTIGENPPKRKKAEEIVTDDGMFPEFKYGDAMELKQITIDEMVPGHTYFVIANGNKLVRIIRQSKSQPNKLILVPSNTEKYDEWEVDKSKITHIYKILSFRREL